MFLKRKRSSSEMSMGSPTPNFNAMDIDRSSESHLDSRTRKRFRDNRPSEQQIHQRTLSILFAAQAPTAQSLSPLNPLNPLNSTARSTAQVAEPMPSGGNATTKQSSLHAFWLLPSPPSSVSSPSTPPALSASSNCEDCDQPLNGADWEMMDLDVMSGALGSGCESCGKNVCAHCSVSNLGAQRMCLGCAGRRRWVGGLGWVDAV